MAETKIKEPLKGEIVIYKDPEGPEIHVTLDDETVWLTQAQISALFDTDRTSITRHIKNIINSSELSEKSNVQNLHIANSDKPVKYYNLDFIISVGYRVNSKRATQFRIWATQRLRDYLINGYAVNQGRLKQLKDEHNSQLKELEQTAKLFQHVLEGRRTEGYEKDLLKIITDYAETWALLHQYDTGMGETPQLSRKKPASLSYEDVIKSVTRFKERLGAKHMAGDLFGQEVGGKLQAALGSIEQTYGGKELYPSLEEKAAHLLYFMIKDHPFADGNKRIASLVFLLYLVENHYLLNKRGERKFNDSALAALALLIAESNPANKEIMVKLVINLIGKK